MSVLCDLCCVTCVTTEGVFSLASIKASVEAAVAAAAAEPEQERKRRIRQLQLRWHPGGSWGTGVCTWSVAQGRRVAICKTNIRHKHTGIRGVQAFHLCVPSWHTMQCVLCAAAVCRQEPCPEGVCH
jgi:hypothetical protein